MGNLISKNPYVQNDGWRSVRKEDCVDHSRGADLEDQGVFWRTGRACPITWLTEDGRGSTREEALSSALSGSPGCPMSGRIYSGGPGRRQTLLDQADSEGHVSVPLLGRPRSREATGMQYTGPTSAWPQ